MPEAISGNPLSRALDWWHGARALWSRVDHPETLSPEDVHRLAVDIGLTNEQLLETVSQPGGSVDLLHRRLTALELDPEDIRKLSPLLLADLERTCAACKDHERCEIDMADDPLVTGWESYCPNASTLKTLT